MFALVRGVHFTGQFLEQAVATMNSITNRLNGEPPCDDSMSYESLCELPAYGDCGVVGDKIISRECWAYSHLRDLRGGNHDGEGSSLERATFLCELENQAQRTQVRRGLRNRSKHLRSIPLP